MRIKWLFQHYCKVIQHKYYLVLSGWTCGVSFWRILIHDWTKFLPSEAFAYARHFNGDTSDPEGYSRAWLHHQNCNPHHWEYWIMRTGCGTKSGRYLVILEMPEKFVREMIADWLAASKSYAGTWDMRGWLEKNGGKIILHPVTGRLVNKILGEVGYDSVKFPVPKMAK